VSNGSGTAFGASTNITAQVTNSTAVYLGYRYSKANRFVRVVMYDDATHGDGAAGDNVFGAALPLNSLSVQYYIYAENVNTGAFSPERAEYEFHSINPTIATATGSQIVLNEVTANNNSVIEHKKGKFKNWLEFLITTNQTLGLSGLYLTGTTDDLTKWNFPSKSLIQPNEHLLVWADDLDKTYLDLHANFNLNAFGDAIYLTDGTNILDSVVFSTQTANSSLSKCADGIGNFGTVANRTPRAVNDCSTSINGVNVLNISLYPNPASTSIQIETDEIISCIEIFSISGKRIIITNEKQIDVQSLQAGCYLIKVNTRNNAVWRSRFVKL